MADPNELLRYLMPLDPMGQLLSQLGASPGPQTYSNFDGGGTDFSQAPQAAPLQQIPASLQAGAQPSGDFPQNAPAPFQPPAIPGQSFGVHTPAFEVPGLSQSQTNRYNMSPDYATAMNAAYKAMDEITGNTNRAQSQRADIMQNAQAGIKQGRQVDKEMAQKQKALDLAAESKDNSAQGQAALNWIQQGGDSNIADKYADQLVNGGGKFSPDVQKAISDQQEKRLMAERQKSLSALQKDAYEMANKAQVPATDKKGNPIIDPVTLKQQMRPLDPRTELIPFAQKAYNAARVGQYGLDYGEYVPIADQSAAKQKTIDGKLSIYAEALQHVGGNAMAGTPAVAPDQRQKVAEYLQSKIDTLSAQREKEKTRVVAAIAKQPTGTKQSKLQTQESPAAQPAKYSEAQDLTDMAQGIKTVAKAATAESPSGFAETAISDIGRLKGRENEPRAKHYIADTLAELKQNSTEAEYKRHLKYIRDILGVKI